MESLSIIRVWVVLKLNRYTKARNGTVYHIAGDDNKSLCTSKDYHTEYVSELPPGAKMCYNCRQVASWRIHQGFTELEST
jgi:hypothetical protein